MELKAPIQEFDERRRVLRHIFTATLKHCQEALRGKNVTKGMFSL